MFYDEKQIENIIRCPVCKKKYRQPKNLPCGEVVCQNCIVEMVDGYKLKEFKCLLCNQIHHLPENGFPASLLVQKLLNEKPTEIHRGELVEQLKKNLAKIRILINEIKEAKSNSVERIETYCSFIKSEVDLQIESQIEQLKKFRDQFKDEIERYKNACLNKLRNKMEFDLKEAKKEKEIIEYYDKLNNYLRQPKLEDSEITTSIEKSKDYIDQLNTQKESLNSLIFNGQMIKFNENSTDLKSDVVGTISYESKAVSDAFKPDKSNNKK